jgi:hypothetical protein
MPAYLRQHWATLCAGGRRNRGSKSGLSTASRKVPRPMGTTGAFRGGVKRPGKEADQSPPTSVEVNNACF